MMSKKITVFDSLLKSRLTFDYGMTFYALLQLTNLIFNSFDLSIDPSDWNLIISNDNAQQIDGSNCGLYVILYINAMFSSQIFQRLKNPNQVRKWLYEVVNQYKTEEETSTTHCTLPKIKTVEIQTLHIVSNSTEDYTVNIINELKRNKLCIKCFRDNISNFNDDNVQLCIICRYYYHVKHELFRVLSNYNCCKNCENFYN